MKIENTIFEIGSHADGAQVSEPDAIDSLFALAKTDYYLARFTQALGHFQKVIELAQRSQRHLLLVESLIFMTRIFLEQGKSEELLRCTHRLQDLQSFQNLPVQIQAKIQYTLGILFYAEENGKEKALQRFQHSIQLCVSVNDHESLTYAIYGIANVYYAMNEYERALSELDKLDEVLKFHFVSDIQVSALLLRAFISRNQGRAEKSFPLIHQACEHLRQRPHVYLYLQALYGLGSTYMKMGDFNSALIYLEIAKVSCPDQLPRMSQILENTLKQCRAESPSTQQKEITFDSITGTVNRKGVGSVSLQGQFVLREMLTLFLESPGKTFSKEELVEKIWKEKYSPPMHDNKIYVTLKRLRQALLPIFPEVESIQRLRNGYSFNHQLFTLIIKGSENR